MKALRKVVCLGLVLSFSFAIGCSSAKEIDGVVYDSYGLLNSDLNKNENIKYKVVWGNVIWGCLLFESIIGPIYFFGFDLFEPVGKKEVKNASDKSTTTA